MKILIINGPNLNRLGDREPDIYGYESLSEINQYIDQSFPKIDLEFYQSNHEGEIIDKIQSAEEQFDGIVLNPGAFAHYSYAIRDAVQSIKLPAIEVHLSNIHAREDFRQTSVTAAACQGLICGMGKRGYLMAIDALTHKMD